MSINALEVLEARFAKREQFVGRGQLHGTELKLVEGRLAAPTSTLPTPEHVYHSPEWWDAMWQKHKAGKCL